MIRMDEDQELYEAMRQAELKQAADDIAKIQEVQQGPRGLLLRYKHLVRRVFIDAGCSPSQADRLAGYDMRVF